MDLPSEAARRAIVTTLARFFDDWEEALGTADLVLPNGDYFPDAFTSDAASVERLFKRMCSYVPIASDLPIDLVLIDSDDAPEGKCASGACGTGAKLQPTACLVEDNGRYVVPLTASALSNGVALATALARSAGALVLAEAGETYGLAGDAELAAVACGLGPILLNGSAVYAKGCGGLTFHQATELDVRELAFATAVFVNRFDHKTRALRDLLPVTQKEAFDVAIDWLSIQADLNESLRQRPALLATGLFEFREKSGFLSRLFG
jgi:hypothetical protein